MPKLLIVANNCLSYHNSNGRTLLNMLGEFSPESLCQIYTSGETAESECCASSLRVVNADVIRSYFGKIPTTYKTEGDDRNTIGNTAVRKTALTMILRDCAWDHSNGMHRHVIEWAKMQHPDAVLLQLGDSTLLITLAMKIAQELSIPLMTYNTEDYYFKQYDYMKRTPNAGIMYRLFHSRFCRAFQKMMRVTSTCIYNCEGLKELYDKEFNTSSHVIYCSSGIKAVKHVIENGPILYAGNLGVGRHKSLTEIGESLYQLDSTLHIDVYGVADGQIRKELENAPGIQYHGVISYDAVCEKMHRSRLLVHVESFNEFVAMDTQYAFSTKLSDCLASGIPLFLYGPTTGEGIRYVSEHSAAFVAEQRSKLQIELERALYDKGYRTAVCQNALTLAEAHHDMTRNGKAFKSLVKQTCERQYRGE